VCGLMFLGKGSCPSCGSKVASDIILDDVNVDDDYIPGLEDVVESLGSTEDEVTKKETLPFGLGAVAETIESSLPFDVGSFTDERVEYVKQEQLVTIQEDLPPEGELPIDEVSLPEEQIFEHQPEEETQSEELLELPSVHGNDDELIPEITIPEVQIPMTEVQIPVVEVQIPVVEVQIPVAEIQDNPVVRLDAEPISAGVTTTEYTLLKDEIPDMWKIDAAEVDIDEIYSQEEKIVEVSYDDDQYTSDVEVSFDDFHYSPNEESSMSMDDSPQLHPAKALAIDSSASPEFQDLVSEGFDMMANQSWIQAAQVFSRLSAGMQNDANVLNNLGLSILQSALEMDADGDTMADSQYEASIMALRQAAKVDPTNNVILLNLAHSLLVSGRAEKALGIVNVVQSRLSGEIEVENLKASCFIQLGRNEEARAILQPFAHDAIVAGNLALI